MILLLKELTGKKIEPIYGPERAGDVKHSKASLEKIQTRFDFLPTFSFEKGLKTLFVNYFDNK
jgi:UDP-N-acetylglucosamine 4-epimerase